MEFYLQDSYATEHLGQLVGRAARGGDVICLTGDLGAGKTLFSRGVATALGVASSDVNSPTFAIMNIYHGEKLEIHHFDLYRLSREGELEDIGFDEYVYGDEVVRLSLRPRDSAMSSFCGRWNKSADFSYGHSYQSMYCGAVPR